ncbi:hypothetical protein N4R57_08090 [Rhodobacteraceae bacterium D3-12]|nr:hypothetical protein N4R57_08090 [Rhodobacteraceae bacterium D3-12]
MTRYTLPALTLGLTLAGALSAATTAHAGAFCELDGTEMFSCTLKNGAKAVEVCDAIWLDGDMVSYGYFTPGGKVEKQIVTDKASVTATPWNGMGNYVSESVTFWTDDGYGYEVYWTGHRGGEIDGGGINVNKDNKVIANLPCDDGSVRHDLTTLIEKIENAQTSP